MFVGGKRLLVNGIEYVQLLGWSFNFKQSGGTMCLLHYNQTQNKVSLSHLVENLPLSNSS